MMNSKNLEKLCGLPESSHWKNRLAGKGMLNRQGAFKHLNCWQLCLVMMPAHYLICLEICVLIQNILKIHSKGMAMFYKKERTKEKKEERKKREKVVNVSAMFIFRDLMTLFSQLKILSKHFRWRRHSYLATLVRISTGVQHNIVSGKNPQQIPILPLCLSFYVKSQKGAKHKIKFSYIVKLAIQLIIYNCFKIVFVTAHSS